MTKEKGGLAPKNVIARSLRRSNPVAGNGRIAAPFGLAMTKVKDRSRNDKGKGRTRPQKCHCEERSDEAILWQATDGLPRPSGSQ